MTKLLSIMALCAGLATTGSGCGGDDSGQSASSPTNAASMQQMADRRPADGPAAADSRTAAGNERSARASRKRGSTVKVMKTRYGRMLVDGRGRALYLFTRDRGERSRCYGACAEAWPPFNTRGKPRARSGARASLLGTTRRHDGKSQVTYKGHPLYYYVGDRRPGQVLCQNVEEFGGVWLVVDPRGRAIR